MARPYTTRTINGWTQIMIRCRDRCAAGIADGNSIAHVAIAFAAAYAALPYNTRYVVWISPRAPAHSKDHLPLRNKFFSGRQGLLLPTAGLRRFGKRLGANERSLPIHPRKAHIELSESPRTRDSEHRGYTRPTKTRIIHLHKDISRLIRIDRGTTRHFRIRNGEVEVFLNTCWLQDNFRQ